MNNLAIIPARSGSKGLANKNIRLLCGRPLISYSISAATESNCFDRIMVSTDSEKYAEIAKQLGAEVPFLRSLETSSDTAGSWEVAKEVVDAYLHKGEEYDTVCLLQPTSPLRSTQDIIKAYHMYEERKADSIISVCESDHSPLWMNTLPEDLRLDNFIRVDVRNANRQQLETYYRLNGAIYIRNVKSLLAGESIYNNSFAYIMPRERSVDIDEELDFIFAEVLMTIQEKQ